MAIKDLEKRREAARLRKQKQRREGVTAGRDILKGVTSINGESVTLKTVGLTGVNAIIPEGVNLYRYVEDKRVEFKEVPEGCKVLSDGQLWESLFEYTEPVKEEPVGHSILRYLVPGERREKMERIVQSLKGHRLFGLNDVLFGIGKVSIGMGTVEELLEATGVK